MTTTLVFDGYCGFCTRSVGWISRLDRHDRLRVVAHQRPGVRDEHGLSPRDCAEAAWTFTPDGRRHRGAGAINAAVGVALGTSLPLRCYGLPGVRQLQDRVYRLVAEHRRHLRGVTPWCVASPGCAPDG